MAADTKPIAEPVARTPHDLGILLVHGIGHQGRGDTLRGFGLPLMRWLKRWLEHPEHKWLRAQLTENAIDEWLDRKVGAAAATHWKSAFQELRTAAGRAPTFGEGAEWLSVEQIAQTIGYPTIAANVAFSDAAREDTADGADATLQIQLLDVKEGPKEHSWLLRESWWATAFRAPKTAEFLFWCLGVVPWVVVAHFARRISVASVDLATDDGRPVWAKWARLLVASFWLLVSPVLALAILFLVSVLGVPGVTRLPVIGSWAAAVRRTLLETVGDSRAFVQTEIDAVQMTATVQNDLEVLANRCRKVVVVAHSQGAAVAYTALLKREEAGKLPVDLLLTFGSGLRKLHELSAHERVAPLGYSLGYLAVSGMIVCLLGLFDPFRWIEWAPTLVGGGLVMFLAGLAPILRLVAAEPSFLSGKVRDSKAWATWEDLYATHDPVPNGRLFLVKDSPLGSRKVDNRASVWTDHTTYWDNFDHFVGMIVSELTRQSSLDASTEPRLRNSITQALDQREWRVRWLQACRTILLVLWIGAIWHAVAFSAAFAVLPVIGRLGMMATALGITICTAAAGFAYAIAAWTWRRWDDADTTKLFRREPYARYTLPFLCFAGIVGSTVGIGAWFYIWPRAAAADRLLVLAAGGLAVGLVCAFLLPILSRKASRVREQQTQRRGAVAPRNR